MTAVQAPTKLHMEVHVMKLSNSVRVLPIILAAAYLGFYVWGLAMGVFTPVELGAFSVVAVVCIVGIVAGAVVARRSPPDPEGRREIRRDEGKLRETRGF